MTGPFAPVLSEPGQANIRPVSTVVNPQFIDTSPLPGIAQAAAQGVDLFLQVQKTKEDATIDQALEAIDQQSLDSVTQRKLEDPDEAQPTTQEGPHALPPPVAGELSKLDKLQTAVNQGNLSRNAMELRRVAGLRKLKAQFPDRIPDINAKVQQMWGYRPTNALIDKAFAAEKAAEAELAAFRQASMRASWFWRDPETGLPGPPRLENGEIDTERAILIGSRILAEDDKRARLAKANAQELAAIQLEAAQHNLSVNKRKAALDQLNQNAKVAARQTFDDSYAAVIEPYAASLLESFEADAREGTLDDAKIQEGFRALNAIFDETVNNMREDFNLASLDSADRKEVQDYISDRRELMRRAFTDKDSGLLMINANLLNSAKVAARRALAQDPYLFRATEIGGPLAARMLDLTLGLDPAKQTELATRFTRILEGEPVDPKRVARDHIKLLENPSAVAGMSAGQAAVNLSLARESMEQFAKDATPLDERAANGFHNVRMNLATSAAALDNTEDQIEAARFFSNDVFYRRMKELEAIDPAAAKRVGTAALTVIHRAVISGARDLRQLDGFGKEFTVQFNPQEGVFQATRLTFVEDDSFVPDPPVPGIIPIVDLEAQEAKSNMQKAIGLAVDLNLGLRTVDEYGHLDSRMAKLDEDQRREAVAATSLLGNTDGSTTNFASSQEAAEEAAETTTHFEDTGELLTATLRAMRRDTLALRTERIARQADKAVKRFNYDPESKTLKPAEGQ